MQVLYVVASTCILLTMHAMFKTQFDVPCTEDPVANDTCLELKHTFSTSWFSTTPFVFQSLAL